MNNVLVSSAGRRVSLVKYFQKELKSKFPNASVFTTDLDPVMSSACRVSDGSFKVGRFSDDDYMDILLDICKANDIKIVVPTIDHELLLYAEWKAKFREHNIHLIVSEKQFVTQCRDKRLINNFFSRYNFLLPQIADIENPEYPIFIKPISGSSSKNIFLVENADMLSTFMCNKEEFIHMEYLSPKIFDEYTCDMYYGKDHKLKCVVPRLRMAVRSGEVSKAKTCKNSIVTFLKDNLSSLPGVEGCITLQLFKHKEKNEFYGIEINPRFGGGYPLSYLSGANYISWILEEYMFDRGVDYFEEWTDDLYLLRHDSEMTFTHDQ